jgi:hypothetical protein
MKRLGDWFASAKARNRASFPWAQHRASSAWPKEPARFRGSLITGVVVLLGALGTASASDALFQVAGNPSLIELSSSANPSVVGQAVKYEAKVTDDPDDGDAGLGIPTGTVDFVQGRTTLCDDVVLDAEGEATCSATYSSAGNRTIEAAYSGDSNFIGSTAELSQVVNKAKTSTTLSSSDGDNRTVSGQAVTYTAQVAVISPGSGTPGGTVAFNDGGTTISGCGTETLSSGVATCVAKLRVGNGSHAVTATYSGNANYLTSSSTAITQTVTPALTQTSLASSKNPAYSTDAVTYTATVTVLAPGSGPATGRVVFKDGGVPISACGGSTGRSLNTSGVAKCSVDNSRVGTHTITAEYLGDANYMGSSSNSIAQVFKYGLQAWISSGFARDPREASFRISGKPATAYRLCLKYDDAWPAKTPPPATGATRYSVNLNYKCKDIPWSKGLSSTRGMARTFGFATKGTYRATWEINGNQIGTDTVSWNTWCLPAALRDIGLWRPGRLKTIDSCQASSGVVDNAGSVSSLDLDFGFRWLSDIGKLHVEYVARDHYYPNPTTGSRNLLPNPGGKGARLTLWGHYQCDTYHGWKEMHVVYMAKQGDEISLTGPQYSTRTPSVRGTWSAHTC